MSLEHQSDSLLKSFLERNFFVYFELAEQTGFKHYQSLFVVFISFIEFLTAHVHSYQFYHIQDGTFLDYAITAFSYFDIFNVIDLGTTIYKVLFYVSCATAYLFLLSYIVLLSVSSKEIKKNFFTPFFVFLSKYYSWLLYFPSLIIMSSRFLCPSRIFQNLQISCPGILPKDDIFTLFLSLSGLFSCIFMVNVNAYFNYSTWYIKTDYFSTHYERFMPTYNLVRLLGAILMVVPSSQEFFVLFYIAKNLFQGIGLLYLLIKYMPFSKFQVQRLFCFFILLYISVSLAMLLDYVTHNQLYPNQSNFLYFGIVFFIVLETAGFLFFEWKIVMIAKSPETATLSFFTLIRKIRVFHYIASSFYPYHLIYFKGLLSLHIDTCRTATCFCKKEKIFDAKKNRELELVKRSQLKGVFGKYLIKNWFESFLGQTTKDPRPSIFYADFLFNKMKNIHMALTHLALADRKSFSSRDKRKIMQLREQIRLYIQEKNGEFRNSLLGFEVIVFLEEQLENIIALKRRFLKKSVKFWTALENSFLDLSEMNKALSELTAIKGEITALWVPLKPYLDSKKQLKYYYQWYLKNLMNKRLKVADEEIKSDEPLEDEDFLSVDSRDLFADSKKEDKLIFQQDSCVIHVKSMATNLGNIHKANSNVSRVFEYNKSEIIGAEIDRIMSPFFSQNHHKYVERFIQNSRSHVIYNMRFVFGLNKSGFIFPLWLVIKQFVDGMGGLEYIALMKPLTTRKNECDYITMNEFGLIDGVSKGVRESLLLEPELLKRCPLNILLISPKLVKFFTYEKFLNKDADVDKKKKERKKKKKSEKIKKMNATAAKTVDERKSIAKIDKKKFFRVGNTEKDLESQNEKKEKTPPAKNSKKSFLKKAIQNMSNHNVPQGKESDPSLKQIPPNGADSPRSTNPKSKVDLNDLVKLNMRESQYTSHKGPKSEKSSESSEKSSSSSDSSSESNTDIKENKTQNIINFIIKLPRNLEKYINFYHELVARKDVNYSTINSLKLFSKTIKEKEEVNQNDGQKKENSESKDGNVPIPNNLNARGSENTITNNQQQRESPRNQVQRNDQNELNCKKELKAIVVTAERISKNRFLNIYKVRALISTRYFGENNQDVLKVLKILSIQKKVEKFSKTSQQKLLTANSEEIMKSQSFIPKKPEENEKVFNLSPTLTNKFFRTRTNTNELSATMLDDFPKPESEGMRADSNQEELKNNQNDNINLISNQNEQGETFFNGVELPSAGKLFIKSFQRNKANTTENLFLKEDTYKARRILTSITKIKWFIRFLFMGIFSMSLLTYFLGPFTQFQTLKNKSTKIYLTKSNELNVLKSYNVLLNFLFVAGGIFNNSLSNETIDQYYILQTQDFSRIYSFLVKLNDDPLMKNVIFDGAVFPSENINYTSQLASKTDSYTILNKDLLFLYIEKLNNIYNSSDFNQISISDPDVEFFRTYILPTIIDLLKDIEGRLFNAINSTKNYINDFMLYILIAEVSMLCFTFVILLRYILQVNNSFQSIIEVFTYIDNSDVRSTKRHFIEMLKTIKSTTKGPNEDDNFTEKTSKFSKGGTFSEVGKKTNNYEDRNEQQFKKLKKFKVGNFLTSIKKRVLIYYFLFIAVSSCLSIGFFFLVRSATSQIGTLLTNGETIIGLIDRDSLLLISLKENMYDSPNYQNKIYPKIADFLPNYLTLQTNLYLPQIDFASFDQISTAYFYTDPCIAYQNLVQTEIDECHNVSLGKLSLGMVSFDNYFFTKISDYVTLKTEEKFGNITPGELYDFDRAIFYTNMFILDILQIWSQDMSNVLDNSYNSLTIYLAFMLLALIGAFIVAENLVVGKLRNTYKYYRGIYTNFMPTELVNKERLIKAKLVISNVLNR